MTFGSTYRFHAFLLAVLFGLFNIGLPVVVASCPMMQRNGKCTMCYGEERPGTVTIGRTIDTSCCATKYAADRNKTEFLQSGQHFADTVKLLVAQVHVLPSPVVSMTHVQTPADNSPPATADIPILISSLLI